MATCEVLPFPNRRRPLLKAGSCSDYAVAVAGSERFLERRHQLAPIWLSVEGTRRGNTLDKLESRLSAWLPRIMDVTVTHVNEARHLHLLHLLAYPVPSPPPAVVSLIAAEMS